MSSQTSQAGSLFVVATPIGNLADLSPRAARVLADVAVIAAEDTRHSKKLLAHIGVGTRLLALHEHNERDRSDAILARLAEGQDVALISDAGTPLISDPGYVLVRAARSAGYAVTAVPGPSALVTALSVAGLPTDRFRFEGFLPAKHAARCARLERLAEEDMTLVFYESSHRIVDSLADMRTCFGTDREAVVARELTKTFETVQGGSLDALCDWLTGDTNQQKGEFVVLVHGAGHDAGTLDAQSRKMLGVLMTELPLKQAAALTAKITGVAKNALYDYGLSLNNKM